MGLFAGVKEARFTDGGSYVGEGVHRLEVIECKEFKTRAGIPAMIIEFKFLESSNPKHAPGSLASHMIQVDPRFPSVGLGNISNFMQTALSTPAVAAAPGVEAAPENLIGPDDITEEACTFACSPAQPLKGTIVRANAVQAKSKMKGAEYTKIKYFVDWDTAGATAG